jgi:hypothetical protein
MPRLRLSVTSVISIIAYFGVGLAALRSGSVPWLRSIYNLTFLTLVLAAIASRKRGRRGTFWFGFAVFGWAYLLVGMGPSYPHIIPGNTGTDGEGLPHPNPNLATTQMVEAVVMRLIGTNAVILHHPKFAMKDDPLGWIRRVVIAHLLLCPPLGLFGGLVALAFAGHDEDRGVPGDVRSVRRGRGDRGPSPGE